MQGMNAKTSLFDRILRIASANPRAVAAVVLLAGAIAAVLGFLVMPGQHADDAEATGEVAQVEDYRSLRGRAREKATIVFQVDGQQHETTTSHRRGFGPEVGDEVTVYYEAHDPSGTAHSGHWHEALGLAGAVAALGGGAGLVACSIRRTQTVEARESATV